MNGSYITRAMTCDGSARLFFTDTTAIVQAAHEIHGTSKTMTAALGRILTATSLMGCTLKEKGIIKYLGGKSEFLSRGYFDGVDIAFMVHTSGGFAIQKGSNGCIAKSIIYKGSSPGIQPMAVG